MLWDLIQQFQISNRKAEVESMEHRITRLEYDLRATRLLVEKLMRRLDEHFGKDIDGEQR